jgi:DNA-binding NarL/FixJ family response regulator
MANREKPSAPPPRVASPEESLSEPLTARETEVLRLLAQGQTNPQIARELVVSPGTVKNHVRDIIAKLGVSDRTQAAVRAMELGLLASG